MFVFSSKDTEEFNLFGKNLICRCLFIKNNFINWSKFLKSCKAKICENYIFFNVELMPLNIIV